MPRTAAFALALVVACATDAAAQKARPQLVADPRTGCKVWNLYPDPDDSILWSGACVDGFANGPGVLKWFNSKKLVMRYEGGYRAGREDGQGTSAWADGNRFTGEFHNGLPNGTGSYTNKAGETFAGTWTNGCFKQGTRQASAHTTAQDCGF